jgi:hypothetical protein
MKTQNTDKTAGASQNRVKRVRKTLSERLVGAVFEGDSSAFKTPSKSLDTTTASYWKRQATQAQAQRDELLAALRPFARLLQGHHRRMADDTPVFAINDATITHRDLRRAQAAIAKAAAK